MLYRGTKPGALYKGAYKPGKLYKGTQLVAGYADVSKAAPASWDGTYDDVMGTATAYEPYVGGQPSPSPDYPQPLVAAEGALTASGRTGITSTTVTPTTETLALGTLPSYPVHTELAVSGDFPPDVTATVKVGT